MRRSILAAMLSTVLCTPIAYAAPYCDALMQTNELPKKYQKKGPFYSDIDMGWIVASDQLDSDFNFDKEAQFLMTEIASAFATRDIKLVLAVPPPRPLFMSAAIEGYDRDKAAASFQSYLENISATGVAAPDLLTSMQTTLGQDAYFQRDTHWTPKGAALAAFSLAYQIGKIADVDEAFSSLNFIETYSEPGSLTRVVDQICQTKLEPEEVMFASFSKNGNASDLLSDTSAEMKKIALAGTSFSNRYNRDVYRFSDALSFALDAQVENYSVSGGGVVSALEALILSDAFQGKTYNTVIWEVPYTQSLSNTHSLRQILGALRVSEYNEVKDVYNGVAGPKWQSIPVSFKTAENFTLQIFTKSGDLNQVDIELYDQSNEKIRIKLRKSSRVPVQLQSDMWPVSIEGLGVSEITKMKIRLKGAEGNQNLSINLIN